MEDEVLPHSAALVASPSLWAPRTWPLPALLLALLLSIAAPILHLQHLAPEIPWSRSDMAPVAIGVASALHGIDPYSPEVTRRIQTVYFGRPLTHADHLDEQHFAYPVTAAIVLSPLALVSWSAARWLFLLLTPPLMALSVPLWLRLLGIRVSHRRMLVLVALTLASWPVMWGVRLCQITLLVAVFLLAGCLLLQSGRNAAAGLALALATIKPQTAGPLLLWLTLWAILQRRWSFVAALAAGTAALLLGAQAIDPGWLPRWRATLTEYARYTRIVPMPQFLLGRWLGGALMLALAAATLFLLWKLRASCPESPAFGLSIALTLTMTICLVPTVLGMNYNDVLLLPAILILLQSQAVSVPARRARAVVLFVLAFGFVAVPLGAFAERLIAPHSRFWVGLPLLNLLVLPACVALALVLYAWDFYALRQPEPARANHPTPTALL